jgi:type III restriction enzyme
MMPPSASTAICGWATLFNLVACHRELEVAFAKYADNAPDTAAFAKNAGPQCLRIDYIGSNGQVSFYTPDFIVRTRDGRYYLIETKGREDRDVPSRARAAMAWCAGASTPDAPWEYLYIPQGVFERVRTNTIRDLAEACRPALQDLINAEKLKEERPLFALLSEADEKKPEIEGLVSAETLATLPERYRRAAEQAATLFRLCENKAGFNFAPVFSALLGSVDESAKNLVVRRLSGDVPAEAAKQKAWFDVYLPGNLDGGKRRHYESLAQNLKKTLVYSAGVSVLGLARSCLDYALNDSLKLGGVFDAVKTRFKVAGGRELLATVTRVNDFRNSRVAHQEQELTDAKLARRELVVWIEALRQFVAA